MFFFRSQVDREECDYQIQKMQTEAEKIRLNEERERKERKQQKKILEE